MMGIHHYGDLAPTSSKVRMEFTYDPNRHAQKPA